MIHFLYATISAAAYLVPFFFADQLFWTGLLAFAFLYQLIDVFYKKNITQRQFLQAAGLWCLMVLAIHLSWFWCLLFLYGGECRIMFGALALVYFCAIMMVPFLLTAFIRSRLWLLIVLFFVAFFGSVYFISYHSFLIFGRQEGYFLFNPILPWMTLRGKPAAWEPHFISATADFSAVNVDQKAGELAACIARLSYDKIGTCVIILPEGIFPYNLENQKDLLPVWSDCHDDIHLIVGAYQQHDGKTYNCAYHVYNGQIQQVYKKQHLVPFFESIPESFLSEHSVLGEVFTSRSKTFSLPLQTENNDDVFVIAGEKYQLFICSELYQAAKSVKNMPVIFIGNNRWFIMLYAKKLAQLQKDYFSWKNSCRIFSSISHEW
jgi:hypothetical protein